MTMSSNLKPRQYIKKQRHLFAEKDPYDQSYGFSSVYVCERRLSAKELMLLNCDAGEDS